MNKKIIVTEKPSVARTFAKVLHVYGNQDGYIENDEWIITWCVGHLVSLSYPEEYDEELKKWSFDTIPFLPENYRYKVISDVRKQFNVIKKLYNRNDISTIYYAGDPAREGIYIQALVRMMAGTNPIAKELVVWIDSQTETEIKNGIKNALPLSHYQNLIDAGYERAIEDYAVGINFSRALTLKAYKTVGKIPNSVNVGRVMTCVLGMVVRREREIENFTPTDYYKIQSAIQLSDGLLVATWRPTNDKYKDLLYNENGFKRKEDAKRLLESLSHSAVIEDIIKKEEKRYAPLLFNLAELQAACSKLFKISPDKTLEIAQSLYEKRMITYPRTDSRYLSSAIASEIEDNLQGLLPNPVVDDILTSGRYRDIAKSKYTNDVKVTDHYAIIPTGVGGSLGNEIEEKVYDLIVKRFLAIFLPPSVYSKVKIIEKDPVNEEEFVATGSIPIKAGWELLYKRPEKDESFPAAAFDLTKGERHHCKYRLLESQTTPPSRYTTGSMILAMENAGNLIEDETLREQIKGSGIGTSATRADTIKKLQKIGHIKVNTKTQVITPDNNGYFTYDFVEVFLPELLNAKLTAEWEQGLDEVANGTVAGSKYRQKLNSYVTKNVETIKNAALTDEQITSLRKYASSSKSKSKGVTKSNVTTYLNVPYSDKDEVKSLGAYFDGEKKCWYIPSSIKDITPFKKWIPDKNITSIKNVYLKVPYEMKDDVKSAGAKWDANKKMWYMSSINPNLSKYEQYKA